MEGGGSEGEEIIIMMCTWSTTTSLFSGVPSEWEERWNGKTKTSQNLLLNLSPS